MLEGKASIEFKKWYFITQDNKKLSLVQFLNMPLVIKWGVYQDFFDSVGIDIGCFLGKTTHADKKYVHVVEVKEDIFDGVKNTRHQAREAAIKKACEIYNNRK